MDVRAIAYLMGIVVWDRLLLGVWGGQKLCADQVRRPLRHGEDVTTKTTMFCVITERVLLVKCCDVNFRFVRTRLNQ